MITSNWEMRDGVGLHSAMLSIIIITLLLVNRYLWQINDVIFCRDWSSGHIPRIFPISNCSVESRLDTPPCLIPHHSLTCTSWHSPDNDGNRSWQEMKGGKQTSQSVITLLQSYKQAHSSKYNSLQSHLLIEIAAWLGWPWSWVWEHLQCTNVQSRLIVHITICCNENLSQGWFEGIAPCPSLSAFLKRLAKFWAQRICHFTLGAI